MAHPHDQGGAAGETPTVTAEDVGQRAHYEPGRSGRGLATGLETGAPERVRPAPGAGGVDEGAGQQRLLGVITEPDADKEGALLTAQAASLVRAQTAFGSDARASARREFVIIDTAPSGHTLLLLDLTGAYHRQALQSLGENAARAVTPLMQLQNPDNCRLLIITIPETTPVSDAAALQEDLRRAGKNLRVGDQRQPHRHGHA